MNRQCVSFQNSGVSNDLRPIRKQRIAVREPRLFLVERAAGQLELSTIAAAPVAESRPAAALMRAIRSTLHAFLERRVRRGTPVLDVRSLSAHLRRDLGLSPPLE